jgi:uncharacterized membrane protein SirB2
MNTKIINSIAGLWLIVNLPIIPFAGSIFVKVDPTLHLVVSIVVLIIFFVLNRLSTNKLVSVATAASLCVVAISILRFDSIRYSLSTTNGDSLVSKLIVVIVLAVIAIGFLVYKIMKDRRRS